MMDRTDRHFRYFMRQLTRRTLLYTEMITTGAIKHGDRPYLLDYDPAEHPVALQVGGDDPKDLAECARVAVEWGYDEINLNVGCPSDRVQSGQFGACLMARPARVADGVAAMRAVVAIPVTVKHRIGIDDLDRYEDLDRFVSIVASAGADRFTVHARKAHLQGLSPKENRTIPPLRYDDVHRLAREHPNLLIEINGGIRSMDAIQTHLGQTDGVMIGRAAYEDPYLFAEADRRIFGDELAPIPSRHEVAEGCLDYIEECVGRGMRLHAIVRHMLPLFAGQPGGRAFRRHISEQAPRVGAGPEVLVEALRLVERAA